MMAEVELTMRAAGDEWCCEPKNGLVALVCGKGEIALEGLTTEGVKAAG